MMTNDLERTMRMNYLYDFYQTLLTEKQQKYIELYYLEDFQFSEIAEAMDVTRQAVYDNLKRSRDLLEHYEETLGMYKNFNKRLELYKDLKEALGDDTSAEVKDILNRLENLD
ncbi:putative DNA-binding protein [Jeotgalicoccus sp. ATCC 8456]|uniref:putative DNA-binding protein n=1 Tax=Jeotgalicoccus sp. ATCC 8456 TaxID=946435 RepID=UPI0018E5F19A|nr:putative DNA-binding protein [Jeotgalicoccus sp. ATCC 8456]QQD86072.1 putative DNA-binding protein [Jeotgalicoccus sp. ATCC 8456]